MSSLAPLLLVVAGADLFGPAVGLELTYAGRLTPVAVADKTAAEKGFAVTWFLPRAGIGQSSNLFAVTEDAAALPWPARFGFCAPYGGETGPRIGYRFAEHDHLVPLPGAVLKDADGLALEREVIDGPRRLTVTGEKRIANRDCRIIEVSTNFGKEATVAVDKASGLIAREERTVFLGRGDRFRLTLDLTEAKPLDEAQAAARQSVAQSLRTIAGAARQGERDPAADLPTEALATVGQAIEPLATAAKGTPFETLAAAIARGLADQQARREGIDGLAKKMVGSPAPPPDLKGLDEKPIDPASLKGKVVLLHFWEYDNDSLAAPYGQVGYLDFLHRRRAKDGVAIVGVAVNPAFGNPETRARAARSAKNLAGFMNLGYPIAADDGTLLRAFGDPRPLGAGLPLWVVIDADGRIRAYKAGLYDLKQNEGLSELDALVSDLAGKHASQPK
jgi:hypothetical protein